MNEQVNEPMMTEMKVVVSPTVMCVFVLCIVVYLQCLL